MNDEKKSYETFYSTATDWRLLLILLKSPFQAAIKSSKKKWNDITKKWNKRNAWYSLDGSILLLPKEYFSDYLFLSSHETNSSCSLKQIAFRCFCNQRIVLASGCLWKFIYFAFWFDIKIKNLSYVFLSRLR